MFLLKELANKRKQVAPFSASAFRHLLQLPAAIYDLPHDTNACNCNFTTNAGHPLRLWTGNRYPTVGTPLLRVIVEFDIAFAHFRLGLANFSWKRTLIQLWSLNRQFFINYMFGQKSRILEAPWYPSTHGTDPEGLLTAVVIVLNKMWCLQTGIKTIVVVRTIISTLERNLKFPRYWNTSMNLWLTILITTFKIFQTYLEFYEFTKCLFYLK